VLVEQIYPSGRVVKNTFDQDGELTQVRSKKSSTVGYWTYADAITRNSAGAITKMQLGNGHWESTTFNNRLQPTQIALGVTPGDTNLLRLDFTYGTTQNNGNIQSQTITVPAAGGTSGFTAVQNYTYDNLNRLKSADEKPSGWTSTNCSSDPTKCWKQTFTYDRYGNRNFDENNTTTLTKSCGSSPSFTVCPVDRKVQNPEIVPSNNRIKEDQDGDSVADYTFDATGNTTKQANGMTFVYDGNSKQTEVWKGSLRVGEYVYDGDGKRVKKKAYDQYGVIKETTIFVYDSSGKIVAEYSTALNPTPQVSYLTNDHLGSPRINTNENGAVISRHDYHPFGEEVLTNQRTAGVGYASDDNRKQFTGYERDNEIELDFAQARYYNTAHGRFTTVDPLAASASQSDPQTFNRYVYVRNSPLVMTDPTGMIGDFFSDTGVWLAHDGKDDGKVYFARLMEDRGAEVDLYRDSIRKTTLDEVIKTQNRAVPLTPGTDNPVAELVNAVAENTETKSRTVRMAAAVAGATGVCIGTAGAGCAPAVRVATSIIEAEMSTAQEEVTTPDSTLEPGPFAGDSVPARGPDRNFTPEERNGINQIGNDTGCHTCGTKNPGTKTGNFVPDHQPPNQLNPNGASQRLFPHCIGCSRRQGGQVRGRQR